MRPHRRRLLTRDFARDINAPDESSLTEDQWVIADLLTNLEEAFFEEKLSAPRRKALARMQVEWQKAELGDQDLRVLRAVEEVGKVITELREQRTPAVSEVKKDKKRLRYGGSRSTITRRRVKGAREAALSVEEKAAADAKFLIQGVAGAFGGEVFGSVLDVHERLLGGSSRADVLKKVGDTMKRFGAARRNGGLGASGVLAAILELAGVAPGGLVKRIDSASTRARNVR